VCIVIRELPSLFSRIVSGLLSFLDIDRDVAKKRTNYMDWEEYFMALAFLVAKRSKDPSTRVGACIVNNDNRVVAQGYNGMPHGCSDDLFPWSKTEDDPLDNKYMYGKIATGASGT